MSPYEPIASYALISDCHSGALISLNGSIDWACMRRFDAPSTFGRILDAERGGFCSLSPAGAEPAGRRYAGDTMILQTDFRSGAGTGRTTDFFTLADSSAETDRVDPFHQLVRIAEGTAGVTEWEFVCSPRFEYGFVHPRATLRSEREATIVGGADTMRIEASVPLETVDGEVRARFRLSEGDQVWFALAHEHSHRAKSGALDGDSVARRLDDTRRFWETWAAQCTYEGPYRDMVIRSALTLKGLTNSPTGAIVAALTTSLPEELGGVRNWDYRYCWIRDASFTLYAMQALGYQSEGEAFIAWLQRTTAGRPNDLQVLYGVGGERLLPEIQLGHLEGYAGSSPVRIGNGAATQFQLDLYGEILDTAHLWRKSSGRLQAEFWTFLRGCVDEIAEHWQEPDEGIWEVRGGRRHFVYSKAMCWVGVDRAIKAAKALDLDAPIEEWRALRDRIRDEILDRGFDREIGAFVQSYDSKELDASALLLPLVGFIHPHDPRVASTVDAIQAALCKDGLVYRYLGEDGLPGGEGTFSICSFWLVDNLAIIGRTDEARALFERLCGFANDVGLFAEQIDAETGQHLGNFPQAFTHMALINSALNLNKEPVAPAPGERPTQDISAFIPKLD